MLIWPSGVTRPGYLLASANSDSLSWQVQVQASLSEKVIPEVLTTKDARLRKDAKSSQEEKRMFCATH